MDRKTVLAFLLIGAILLVMPYYFKLVSPPPEETADSTLVEEIEPLPSTITNNTPDTPEIVNQEEIITLDENDDSWMQADPAHKSKTIKVETPLYSAQFNTMGASVSSWIIKPTKPYLSDYEQLIRSKDSNRNLVLLSRGKRGLFRSEEKNFQVNRENIDLREGDNPQALIFTLDLGNQGVYKEIYTFHPDKYSVDIHIESNGLGRLTGAGNALFTWGGAMAATESDSSQDLFYTEASYMMGSAKEKFTTKGKKAKEENPTGPTNWVAQRTKYFLMAMVPEKPAYGVKLASWPEANYNGKYTPKLYETGLLFNLNNGEINQDITLYLGPMEKSFIEEVDPSLIHTMSWGWPIIRPFSMGILWLLKFMHEYIPNYGIVLIIFSVLIKIVVWPLTHKAHGSMKRMQMLQPMMKEIQAKYKDNSQKLQSEMMKLYKEHKVNPMGGCWPTLLQLPLLYSLFIVFRSTIELRGAPFMLWIKDLSMPDVLIPLGFEIPLYGSGICVLPFVMAISTFLQSKSTMTDPNQKAMLYMMPVMFIVLFNNFPSGLTLYYTLFNILTWGQQKMMKISDPNLDRELDQARINKSRADRKKGLNK